jgi:sodium-independent sulfate anion transporter 11
MLTGQENSVVLSLTDEKTGLDSREDLIVESQDTDIPNVNACAWLQDRIKRSCTRKVLHKRIPIFDWAPKYNATKAISDLLAGITVGLTVIPQAIAYANVAGIPPEYGLYSSFVGCFVYTIFGSCKDSPIGPTAIAAILTRENIHDMGPQFAILLCFVTGCVELIMGVLQLGKFFLHYLSPHAHFAILKFTL